MVRKRIGASKRKLMLYPFMDIFFVLLVFFIAIAIIARDIGTGSSEEVRSAPYKMPREEPGRTNILVQLCPGDSAYWLDAYRHSEASVSSLADYYLPYDRLPAEMLDFCELVAYCSQSRINLVIRCDDKLDYLIVKEVRQVLEETVANFCDTTGSPVTLNVGLLSGSLSEIRSWRINQQTDAVSINFNNAFADGD